jgi:hypothetical protein
MILWFLTPPKKVDSHREKNLQIDEISTVHNGDTTTFKGIENTELVIEEKMQDMNFLHLQFQKS